MVRPQYFYGFLGVAGAKNQPDIVSDLRMDLPSATWEPHALADAPAPATQSSDTNRSLSTLQRPSVSPSTAMSPGDSVELAVQVSTVDGQDDDLLLPPRVFDELRWIPRRTHIYFPTIGACRARVDPGATIKDEDDEDELPIVFNTTKETLEQKRKKIYGSAELQRDADRNVMQVVKDVLLDAFEETYVLCRRTGIPFQIEPEREEAVFKQLQDLGVPPSLPDPDVSPRRGDEKKWISPYLGLLGPDNSSRLQVEGGASNGNRSKDVEITVRNVSCFGLHLEAGLIGVGRVRDTHEPRLAQEHDAREGMVCKVVEKICKKAMVGDQSAQAPKPPPGEGVLFYLRFGSV